MNRLSFMSVLLLPAVSDFAQRRADADSSGRAPAIAFEGADLLDDAAHGPRADGAERVDRHGRCAAFIFGQLDDALRLDDGQDVRDGEADGDPSQSTAGFDDGVAVEHRLSLGSYGGSRRRRE